MVVVDRIHQYVQKLPPALQAEVLDFVEYLFAKVQQERSLQEERRTWSELSLEGLCEVWRTRKHLSTPPLTSRYGSNDQTWADRPSQVPPN
ncbi:MAG: DUF2281 domain-containing protein [Anaerolineae bacterium]